MFFFDPLYLLFMMPPLIFMIYAQFKVSSAFNKYSKIANMQGMTGAQVAHTLLRVNGLDDVKVEQTKGKLSDHYDPGKKVLRLSPDVYSRNSVAAMGIVAHEVGHAVQDKVRYPAMALRSALVPAANIGSTLGWVVVMVGILIYSFSRSEYGWYVAWGGVGLFGLAVLFTLVTLPVEYDASNRARKMMMGNGLVSTAEYAGASAVLSAAALTYVAALLQALAQLMYFVFMLLGMRGRDR
ncbi:MAG TPA: zinc metallopeptidase [Dehalococcoidia bacterium]|nr:zinc metallopeptidase [Dehalococcoidia bacterium]